MLNKKRPVTTVGAVNKKARNLISWKRVRSEMKRRSAARPSATDDTHRRDLERPSVVVMFSPTPARDLARLQRQVEVESPPPREMGWLQESHAPAEPGGRWDPQSREPQTFSATQDPPPHDAQSPGVAACTEPKGQTSDPAMKVACPIMGNILLASQRVEIYPPETHYPKAPVVSLDMAKPPANQEPKAVTTLRDNVKALLGDKSYRALAKAAEAPATLGRTVNGFVIRETYPRVDLMALAADGLNIEMWQLFIPSIAELDAKQRAELQEVVKAFVSGGDPVRQMLIGSLRALADAAKAASGESREEIKTSRLRAR